MKLKGFIGGYINKFYGEKSEYRTNKYLLVNKKGKLFDYNGFGGTRRELHDYYEIDKLEDVYKFLDEEVSKSNRKNYTLYKRYENIPTKNKSK